MRMLFHTILLLAFVIQLDKFILQSDAKEQLHKPKISLQIIDETVDLPCQAKQINSNSEISCNLYVGDSTEPYNTINSSRNVCNFFEKLHDLRQALQTLNTMEVSCDYTVRTEPLSRSPRSDRIRIPDKTTSAPPVMTKQNKRTTSSPPVTTEQTLTANYTDGFGTRGSLQSYKTTSPPPVMTKQSERATSPPPVTTEQTSTANSTDGFGTRGSLQSSYGILAVGIGSAVGAIVLGVSVISLHRIYRKKKQRRAVELINGSLSASVKIENILNASDTGGIEGIYMEINDPPSTFKSPPAPSQDITYSVITAVPGCPNIPLSDRLNTDGNMAPPVNTTPQSISTSSATDNQDSATYSTLQMH